MQYREAFVVLLIIVSLFGAGRGDDSEDFVNTKQEEVRTIALAAAANYANTCELVSTCLSPQNCSRLECYPLPNQSDDLSCVYVNDNMWCTNTTGGACNTVKANFGRGYVRTPPLNFGSAGGTFAQVVELYLGSTICAQRSLDPTFQSVNGTLRSNSSVDYFYNLYFGAVDGTFRYYPGRELLSNDCGKYDPRIRPWYIGAISILKDLVILIDTGTAMQQTNFLNSSTSYLEMTTSMMVSFLNTLAAGDRITVFPVNTSGSDPGHQYNVSPIQGLDPTDPNFQGLLAYINGSTFSQDAGSNGAATNFTAGFVEAISTFEVSPPANSMKIVMLITNSQSNNVPNGDDLSAAVNLKDFGAQLFVYDLSPSTSVWTTYACQDGESHNFLSINPLLFFSSYFSFLARARIAAHGGQPIPFWKNPYSDASDLGQVITVSYPAMSADGLQLIGVAGIDVQLAGLDTNPLLMQGVESILTNSAYRLITQYPYADNLSICNADYLTNCSGITPGSTKSLCTQTTQPASDKQLTALLCCPDCTKSSSNHIALWVVVGILCALFVLMVLAVIYLLRRSWRKRKRKKLALDEYSYEALRKATNCFSTKNIIGKGSFGVVYKAVLGNETVAVKQLPQPADRAADFEAEIKILGITSHPNLVELKGTCFQPTQCFLVYELVDGGDLHDWLWPVEKEKDGTAGGSDSECWTKRFLTYKKREIIAKGVARGLNYLHHGLEPNGTVFHLDIKPHNILLEYNFNPKIADFGISQLYEPGYTFKVNSVVRGTFGYIAPEVLQGQMKPNSKLDVYSYGMVLLQLVSGRKIDDPGVHPFLLRWAKNHVDDACAERVVDENLIRTVGEAYREPLMANCKQLINLALRCLSDKPELRPEMKEVLEVMGSLRDVRDLETPSSSDCEDSRPCPEKSADGKLKKSRSSTIKRLLSFSGEAGERDGASKHLTSESEDELESTGTNPEIAPSVSSPLQPRKDQDSRLSGSKIGRDSSDTQSRSSGDSSYKSALGMPNSQVEPKSRTLRRSASS